MRGQRDLLMQALDLQSGIGQIALAQAQFKLRIEAGVQTLLHQFKHLRALRQQALRQRQLSVQPCQLKVVARHRAGQQCAGRIGIRLRGARAAQGSCECSAVLAKKIELPVATELRRAGFSY